MIVVFLHATVSLLHPTRRFFMHLRFLVRPFVRRRVFTGGTLGIQEFKAALASMGISGPTDKILNALMTNAAASSVHNSNLARNSDRSCSTSAQDAGVVSDSQQPATTATAGTLPLHMQAKATQLKYVPFATSLQR